MAKVIAHPGASHVTPMMTLAEAVGLSEKMETVLIIWTDACGDFHVGWSALNDCELAAHGAVLTHVAARRLIAGD